MSNTNTQPQPERRAIVHILATNPIERRLRAVRAYVVPIRGPAGFRRIPVARYSTINNLGFDAPILSDAWTVQGLVDELAIPVEHPGFGGFGPRWDVYNIWYTRPVSPRPTVNPFMRCMNGPPVTGEFVIFRQTENGDRLMDVRRMDYASIEIALMRLVNVLILADRRWLVGQ